MAITYLMLHKT